MSDITIEQLAALQERHNNLLEAVKRMRVWQMDYEKYHGKTYYGNKRRWEQKVDQLIKEGIKETGKDNKQPELF